MALFDGLIGAQPGILGTLPPWMQFSSGGDSALPPWLQNVLGGPKLTASQGFGAPPQQQPDALPANAQPASLSSAQLPMAEPRKSIFDPPDSFPGAPPLDRPGMPSPLGAPSSPQQPAPGMNAMVQAPAQQGGGSNFMSDLIQRGPLGAISNSFETSKRQQVYNSLIASGVDPKQAWFIMNAPAEGQMAGLVTKAGGTSDIQEYEYAKKQGFNGTFEQWMQRKRAGAGEYGMQPVYGTRTNPQTGKQETVIMQLGKGGDMIESRKPEGVEFSPGIEKIDLGTEWGLYDKRAGMIVGRVAKDVQGKEAAEERGKAQGQAQVNLTTNLQNADRTVKQIDELMNHNGLDSIVGPFDQFRPSWTLRSEGRDALARYEQLKGTAFLQAYATLRGGGAITEIEGTKAENAMARMQRAQGEAEFRSALKDFRDAVEQGVAKLKNQAGGNFGVMPAAPAGASPNLRQKYGLE